MLLIRTCNPFKYIEIKFLLLCDKNKDLDYAPAKTDEPEHQPSLIRAFTCAYSVAKELNSDQPGCKVQIQGLSLRAI